MKKGDNGFITIEIKMNAPNRLKHNLKLTMIKDGTNIIVGGQLSCCNQHEFEVSYQGTLKKSLFRSQYLRIDDNGLILNARCMICGKEVIVFDSHTDGYDKCIDPSEHTVSNIQLVPYDCPRCSNKGFNINLEYEFLSKEEIDEEGIEDYENSFTWIRVALKCTDCGKVIKKIIDYETA